MYYLDVWPAGDQMLIVAEPEVAQQLIQNTHKHAVIKNFMPPLDGDHSLVSMDGKEWLKWRKIFNPGFSLTNLLTLVPGIVEDALTFCEVLEEHARKGDIFRLEEVA